MLEATKESRKRQQHPGWGHKEETEVKIGEMVVISPCVPEGAVRGCLFDCLLYCVFTSNGTLGNARWIGWRSAVLRMGFVAASLLVR